MKQFVKSILLFLGVFPPPLNQAIAYFLALLLYSVYRLTPQRNFIYNNLRLAFREEKTPRELHRLAWRNVCHLSLSIMEILRFPFLTSKDLRKMVKIEGLENFLEAANLNRGVISTSAHFGNWELLGPIAVTLGISPYVLTVRQAGLAEEILGDYRRKLGVTPISRWNNLRYVLKILQGKNAIGILNDQHGEYNNLRLEFFGHQVSVPTGPANFAILGQTPMLPTFIVRQKDFTHVLHFERPIYPDPQLDKKANVAAMLTQYLAVLEKYIRAYPEQWFWVYNRFDKLPPGVVQ